MNKFTLGFIKRAVDCGFTEAEASLLYKVAAPLGAVDDALGTVSTGQSIVSGANSATRAAPAVLNGVSKLAPAASKFATGAGNLANTIKPIASSSFMQGASKRLPVIGAGIELAQLGHGGSKAFADSQNQVEAQNNGSFVPSVLRNMKGLITQPLHTAAGVGGTLGDTMKARRESQNNIASMQQSQQAIQQQIAARNSAVSNMPSYQANGQGMNPGRYYTQHPELQYSNGKMHLDPKSSLVDHQQPEFMNIDNSYVQAPQGVPSPNRGLIGANQSLATR